MWALSDGIADIAVRPLHSGHQLFLDLTFVSASSVKFRDSSVQSAIRDAAHKKATKYSGRMLPLTFCEKGRIDPDATQTLFSIAGMCAGEIMPSPGRLLHRWLRAIELARVSALAETMLLVLGSSSSKLFGTSDLVQQSEVAPIPG